MMRFPLVLSAFWVGAGIALIAAVQATIIAALGHCRRLFLTFSFVCFSAAGLLGSTAVYYMAQTVAAAGLALQWQMTFILLAIPYVYSYVALYTGLKRPPAIEAVLGFSCVLFIVNLRSPYSLRFRSLAATSHGHFSGVVSPWWYVVFLELVLFLVWGSWRTWLQYRRGEKRAGLFLGLYLWSQIVALVWSAVIDHGAAHRFYLGGFSFLIIVVLMSVKLGIDLRERDRGIRRAATDWKETFDSLRTPILLTDVGGAVLRANRAACELSPDRDAEPWKTARTLVDRLGERGVASAETKDERGRTWELTASRFASSNEGEARCILALWDISNLVELQESLRKRERISAMGALLAGVAHEVRNPLFGISATLDAYDEELSVSSLKDFGDALRSEVKRLIRLMQELLDFGKPAAMKMERGGLATVVVEAVGRFAAVGVKVAVDVAEALPPVVIDRARLRQVFENLIDNALQHSPAGGVVQIVAAPVEHNGRRWVECRVDDNGPGFIPADIERVWEPFYSRRDGGTGLGLSIVQRIVEDHSGQVSAANRHGGGASVRVRLPIQEEVRSEK